MRPDEILLVEDSPEDVELTKRALEKNNLVNSVRVARDGQEALDFLFGEEGGATPPRVILLDLKMPKVDGFDVLAQLRRSPEMALVPVVVLTSSQENTDIKKAYAMGANSYIVKPVDFDKFVTAVSDVGLYWLLLNEPPK